jgi:hypothetical protein
MYNGSKHRGGKGNREEVTKEMKVRQKFSETDREERLGRKDRKRKKQKKH